MLSATAATRAPSGAVSVPLPRTPKENILSNTAKITGVVNDRQQENEIGLTGGHECFRGRLASKIREGQWWTDAF